MMRKAKKKFQEQIAKCIKKQSRNTYTNISRTANQTGRMLVIEMAEVLKEY